MYICGLLLSNQYSMSFVWHLGTGDVCKVYSLLDIWYGKNECDIFTVYFDNIYIYIYIYIYFMLVN